MKKSTLIFLILNFSGLLLFLLFNLGIRETMKAEQRNYVEIGDSLNFLTRAVPVLLLCFIYSFIWGIKSAFDAFRWHNYQGFLALSAVVGAWIGLILILRSIN